MPGSGTWVPPLEVLVVEPPELLLELLELDELLELLEVELWPPLEVQPPLVEVDVVELQLRLQPEPP